MQHHSIVRELLELLLKEDSGQTFHLLVLKIRLVFVAVKFFTQEHEPVFFESAPAFLFLQDFALIVD